MWKVIILSKKKKLEWYNNGNTITSLIIAIIVGIIVCSQSFANNEFSMVLFSSVINRNSIYLLVLIYFVFLKFSFGRKYFNYLNVFLSFIYFIVTITSLLTMVQFFSINAVLNFLTNILLLIYMSHTLFRDTRIWKEFHFYNSPFNELTNENFFYAIIVASLFTLVVNLISIVDVSGVIISTLNALFLLSFARYIFLYRDYLDKKQLDSNNKGNFDDIKEKIQEVLDKTDIDDMIVDGVRAINEVVNEFVDKKENDLSNEAQEDLEEKGVDITKEEKENGNSEGKVKSKKKGKKGDK